MRKGARSLAVIFLVALMVLSLGASAGAVELASGDMVVVPQGQIQGPLFVAGNNIVINADVDGDVFAAAQTITVNGKVGGDVMAAAQTIRLNGEITGDARCAAAEVSVNGTVGQNLTAAAAKVLLDQRAAVGRDALVLAGETRTLGSVGRQVLGSAGLVELNGKVGGDVRLWDVEQLKVGPRAEISGNLSYGSPQRAEIASGAKIAGQTKWEQIAPHEDKTESAINWVGMLISFTGGVIAWGILALLFPQLWGSLGRVVRQSPWAALGWGLLLLLVTPLAALLLLLTVVGIPLSLALVAVYIALLWGAKIIVGDVLGRVLARRFGWEGRVHAILPFLIGLAAVVLSTNIPIVGGFITLVVACLAIGTVVLAVYRWRQRSSAPLETV
ncbi:MAG: polymer-forming cytoskeletal protein [Bacillota bacterium]